MDREKVIAGLTMLADRKNDNSCEGLKCCKIAEDAISLLKEQEAEISFLKRMQLQIVHNMSEEDLGDAVYKILRLKGR